MEEICFLLSISHGCFLLHLVLFFFFHKHHEIIIQREEERERLIKKLVFQFEAFTDNQKLLELRFQGSVI